MKTSIYHFAQFKRQAGVVLCAVLRTEVFKIGLLEEGEIIGISVGFEISSELDLGVGCWSLFIFVFFV